MSCYGARSTSGTPQTPAMPSCSGAMKWPCPRTTEYLIDAMESD